jgi:hypothetical protein
MCFILRANDDSANVPIVIIQFYLSAALFMNGTSEESNQVMIVFNGRELCWWVIGPCFFYEKESANPKVKM